MLLTVHNLKLSNDNSVTTEDCHIENADKSTADAIPSEKLYAANFLLGNENRAVKISSYSSFRSVSKFALNATHSILTAQFGQRSKELSCRFTETVTGYSGLNLTKYNTSGLRSVSQ